MRQGNVSWSVQICFQLFSLYFLTGAELQTCTDSISLEIWEFNTCKIEKQLCDVFCIRIYKNTEFHKILNFNSLMSLFYIKDKTGDDILWFIFLALNISHKTKPTNMISLTSVVGIKGWKCAMKISLTPLQHHQHHQPKFNKPLLQDRMDPRFHAVCTNVWPCNVNVGDVKSGLIKSGTFYLVFCCPILASVPVVWGQKWNLVGSSAASSFGIQWVWSSSFSMTPV